MDELAALKDQISAQISEFTALGETLTKPDHVATPEENARFNELDSAIKANQDKIASLKERIESESDRNARLNRIAQLKEWESKIKEENFRNPNDDGLFRGADLSHDFALASAAWGRMGCSDAGSAPTARDIEAGKRLGVNIASGEFKITNPDILRVSANNLRHHYARLRAEGVTMANVEIRDAQAIGGETDSLDSRSPERAGYLNRAPEFLTTLEMNMVSYGGIMQAPVTFMVTDHYEDVVETYGDDTVDDAGNAKRGRQIGEGDTIGTTKQPKFKEIVWKAYDYTSDDIVVNNRQLERSRFNLPPYIAQMLGERLGRKQSVDFTTGAGAVNPQGIQTVTTAMAKYLTTASSLVIGYDDVINLPSKLDQMFWRYSPTIGYMCHPGAWSLLRTIKDLNGLPIFKIGAEGTPATGAVLDGRPVFWNNDMTGPSAAGAWTAGDKAMIFGDFSRFVIRRAGGGLPTLIRDETTSRRQLKTIFTALVCVDSRVRNYGTPPFAEMRIKA